MQPYEIVRSLRGVISETARSRVAWSIVDQLRERVQQVFTAEEMVIWEDTRPDALIRMCDLTCGMEHVPNDFDIEATALSEFINRWMAIQQYRDAGGEWQPFSPEMHGVRVSMVEELKEIRDGHTSTTSD